MKAGRCLACAKTNNGADNLIRRARKQYGHLLRYGAGDKVPEDLRGLSSHCQASAHFGAAADSMHRYGKGKKKEMAKWEAEYVNKNGWHLFGTLMSSANLNLLADWAAIVIDEAGQATEPETIMPLIRAGELTRIVIIGDSLQRSSIKA